jgi:hypothetical protein
VLAVGEFSCALDLWTESQRLDKKKVIRSHEISYGWAGGGARDGSSPANFSRNDPMLCDSRGGKMGNGFAFAFPINWDF